MLFADEEGPRSVSGRAERGPAAVPRGAQHAGDPAQAVRAAPGPQPALRVPPLRTRARYVLDERSIVPLSG